MSILSEPLLILNGFDGYKYSDGNYQNLAVNLFPSGNTLYGGIITQYVPEYSIPPALSELKGSQIWKTSDVATWTQVTNNGFGDKDIIIFEGFVDFNCQLYVSGSKGASSTPRGLAAQKYSGFRLQRLRQLQFHQRQQLRFRQRQRLQLRQRQRQRYHRLRPQLRYQPS